MFNNVAFMFMEPKTMLTTKQVADKLNVHPETVRRMVKSGKIQAISLGGKYSRFRISEKELQAFMDGNIYPIREDVIYDGSKPPKQGTYQPPLPYLAIKLSIGEPYPLPILQSEGASAQFLTKSGNILQIVLPGMDSKEETAFKSGMIKAGFLYDGGAMLLLFNFYDDNGKLLLSFDAPFNSRLLPSEELNPPNIDNPEQPLTIEIHAIDEKNIVRALRLVTMPPVMTLKFLSAVQDQLTDIDKPDVMAKWMQQQSHELINQTESWTLGN